MLFQIVLNVGLAVVWCLLWNEASVRTFVLGFGIGAALLYFTRLQIGGEFYLGRAVLIARLAYSFLWELLLANLTVVRQVLSVPLRVRPGIVAYPLRVRSELGTTVLANLITLTPGTLSLDLSPDQRTLYIHTLNVDDPDALRESIRRAFEDLLIELEGGSP